MTTERDAPERRIRVALNALLMMPIDRYGSPPPEAVAVFTDAGLAVETLVAERDTLAELLEEATAVVAELRGLEPRGGA